MKFIKGKNNKMLKVNEIVNKNKYNNVLIINPHSNYTFGDYDLKFDNYEDMFRKFTDDKILNSFIEDIKNKGYDLLIFNMNDNINNLDCYGVFDDKLNIDIIILIQDDNEELEIFEV